MGPRQVIENLTEWVQETICDDLHFLKPNEEETLLNYTPEYTTPKAYPMYIPTKDMLPKGAESTSPAVAVQLLEGQEDLTEHSNGFNIRLACAVWNPGKFTEDETGATAYQKNADGWRDAWLFVEKAKTEIQKHMYIAGAKVDRSTPIKFGPFTVDDEMVVEYPYWYSWVSFRLEFGSAPVPVESYQEFL